MTEILEKIIALSPDLIADVVAVSASVTVIILLLVLYRVASGMDGKKIDYVGMASLWVGAAILVPTVTAIYCLATGFFLNLFVKSLLEAFFVEIADGAIAAHRLYIAAVKGIAAYGFVGLLVLKMGEGFWNWTPVRNLGA